MPCSDYRPGEHSVLIQRRLDAATRLLCGLCEYVESRISGEVIGQIYGLTDWWAEHKKKDEERMECVRFEEHRRKVKQAALSKLTDEERKVLGLKVRKGA